MNYIKTTPADIANGPGCRVVLWVAGCSHHCNGCHNPETWSAEAGVLFDETAKKKLYEYMSKPYISGITLSGGDPLYKDNISDITQLCKELKERFPQKTIWCYSGYTFEEMKQTEIMHHINVLVDGKFQIEKKDITLLFRGSSNQRIIDVQASLKQQQIVLYKNGQYR